ncbi:BEL1-like homeodomain protein 1 [Vicia villosa]|uniref:BEL1-like homeodomain protein 1 n=1 Tax=Vicia villosa TaxID=3911 RepID=UPI00273BD842|nr:BEL1-like homeodomain protein 1 [Vicia villosa]
MATYFHGSSNASDIQPSAEGMQTLYLMNPNYVVPYSEEAQNPTQNMLFANPNATTNTPPSPHALNAFKFPHAPSSHNQHNLVGFNFHGSNSTDSSTQPYQASGFHSFASSAADTPHPPHPQYNTWGSGSFVLPDQTVTAVTATNRSENVTVAAVTTSDATEFSPPQIAYHHRPVFQRGLSLSLSSQQPPYRSFSGKVEASRGSGVVFGSKYLKVAQELLDEVVNVDKGIINGESVEGENTNNNDREKRKANIESSSSGARENDGGKQVAELSTAQRQELQMKKSKLVNMLDEVELRYKQYHHQMHSVISSFESATGYGAAKSYTSLALKTISKQFRSLKDAIASQIKTTSKSLGEDDCLGVKLEGSRLRYVDHHLRQQRALQQLGMIQNNAWRPQRGLPERAVSVLRAWLFEHFLHPYPKDSDKVMLARQTGLTRSQVSNWFINARVRLWKPMVEEMYMEEIKEQEEKNGSKDNVTNTSKESSKELWSSTNATQESSATKIDQINVLNSKTETFNNNQNTSPTEISNSNNSISVSPMEMKSNTESNTKFDKNGYPLLSENENHGGGYGSIFSMEDIGRYNVSEQLAPRFHGNGVSLSLGLPHNENLPLSSTQHGFLSHMGGRIEMRENENEFCGINTTTPSSHSGTSYESVDIQNKKRFATQLLRNFAN